MKDSARSGSRRKPDAGKEAQPQAPVDGGKINKYRAVLLASQEARRIKGLASTGEAVPQEKPVVAALKRLAHEKLKREIKEESAR